MTYAQHELLMELTQVVAAYLEELHPELRIMLEDLQRDASTSQLSVTRRVDGRYVC